MPNLYGELIRSQFENLASDPSQGTTGRIWWNTAAGQAKLDNGSSIRAFLLNDQHVVFGNDATPANNARLNRSAAATLQLLIGSDATAEGAAQTDTTKWASLIAKIGGGLVDTFLTYSNQGSTPATPASGFSALYAKADGFYRLDSNGAETKIGAGSGAINYVGNSDAETNTTGWATYADAAGAAPVDGTGGSPTVTWTRSTSTPLRGTGSFLLTKDAANRQGQGASYDFTIANADQAQPLQIGFEYTSSGAFVAGTGVGALSDVVVYIYDKTNGVLIQPTPFVLPGGNGSNHKFSAKFQSASNSVAYRLIFHVASVNASAWTLTVDDVSVSPQLATYGSPVTDWIAYTPVLSNFGTATSIECFYRRVGDSIDIKGRFVCGTVVGSAALVGFPAGLIADANKIIGSSNILMVGRWLRGNSTGATVKAGVLSVNSAALTGVSFSIDDYTSATSPFVALNAGGIFATSDVVEFCAEGIPVSGWASNVLMSQDTSARVVSAVGYLGTNDRTVTAGTPLEIIFDTTSYDTHGAFNISNGRYTAPVAGYYSVKYACTFLTGGTAASEVDVWIYKNGTGTKYASVQMTPSASAKAYCATAITELYLNAGDYVSGWVNASGQNVTVYHGSGQQLNPFSITRISGPATIAASETVAAKAYNCTTAVTTSGPIMVFATKIFDTHGSYNATTGLFTCPTAGKYRVMAMFGASTSPTGSANTSTIMACQKNGVQTNIMGTFARQIAGALTPTFRGETIEDCLAGDTLAVTISRDAGDSANFTTGGSQNSWLSFDRIGGLS